MCPSSGENYYATLVFVTLYGWRLVCYQTRRHPYRVTNTSVAEIHCLLMMATWMPETCREEK